MIADDGSRPETTTFVNNFKVVAYFPWHHVWQEDIGFRKSLILNVAIARAQGECLVFLDGDCLVQPDFIAQHRLLARPGHLVTGSKVLLGSAYTQKCLNAQSFEGLFSRVWKFDRFFWQLPLLRCVSAVNKFLPFIVKFPLNRFRIYSSFVWRRIKGCNMACWKTDAVSISGFDAALTGWGHEDAVLCSGCKIQGLGVFPVLGLQKCCI